MYLEPVTGGSFLQSSWLPFFFVMNKFLSINFTFILFSAVSALTALGNFFLLSVTLKLSDVYVYGLSFGS